MFFHAQIVVRKRRNNIDRIFIDGDVWCTNNEVSKNEANNFFKSISISS